MNGRTYSYICRSMTTFDGAGRFDALQFGDYLERFVASQIGFYCASSGSGVGQSLSPSELKDLYTTAVSVGRGKVTVGANIPEEFTATASLGQAVLAADCGVDIINIYGPDGRHGYQATDDEYTSYFDYILREISHPVSLNPLPLIGYTPKPSVVAAIANKYPQVRQIILTGLPPAGPYFMQVRDALRRDVEVYPTVPGSLNYLLMGASGLVGSEANILPRTVRRYLDAVSAGDLSAAAGAYADLERTHSYTAAWSRGGGPRMLMMFVRLYKLPGWRGKLPQPYVEFDDEAYGRFASGMLDLDVEELRDLAISAGHRLGPA